MNERAPPAQDTHEDAGGPRPPGDAGPGGAPADTGPRRAPGDAAAKRGGRDGASTPLDTRELFRDGREIVILHRGEAYRLKLTRQDKLILTK